jgi:3',5'-cyclic AMP phosphodiesterase CpdA
MRFLHVSDLHVDTGVPAIPLRDMLNKRLVGWANLRLRRARYYKDAVRKIELLAALAEEHNVDAVLCTGDYTVLGTPSELRNARAAVEPLVQATEHYVTVPGNHDVYIDDRGLFHEEFGEFLTSDLPEYQCEGRWPLVKLFDGIAVVCIDSTRPNPSVFSSAGYVPNAQLDALGRLLASPELHDRFVFVMTHYAPRLASGNPDTEEHGLGNANEVMAACAIERGAFLHGHVHKCFTLRVPECQVPIFGAGSSTMAGHEGLWMFDVDADGARAFRGRFAGGRYQLDSEPTREW